MINKYLIDAFEEFESKQTYKTLIEFAEKTFPKNGTDKLFIGCSLKMEILLKAETIINYLKKKVSMLNFTIVSLNKSSLSLYKYINNY